MIVITLFFRRLVLSFFIVLLISGCASTTGTENLSENEQFFTVPYSYKSFGVGPQPQVGVLTLNEGSEARIASLALLEAIQSFQLSVIESPANLDTLLSPDQLWKTDIAPVERKIIEEHNQKYPQMILPIDRYYGIQYVGRYNFKENKLNFILESILYQKGSGSNFRPYSRNAYSGNFFFERLKNRIKECLLVTSCSRGSK